MKTHADGEGPARPRPARARALSFLRAAIADAGDKRVRLPGLHALARKAGVSYETMRAAVRDCASEGLLEPIAGSGVFVPGRPIEEIASIDERTPKWRGVRERILRDIRQGRYEPGSLLPALKTMEHDYGISYGPLSRALRTLASEGVLEPYRRGYRLSPLPHHDFVSSIVLVLRGGRTGEIRFPGPRTEQNLWLLQQECARRGIVLHVVTYRPVTGIFTFHSGDPSVLEPAGPSPVLGYLLWTTALSRSTILRAFDRLRPLGRPVAVLDEVRQIMPGDLPTDMFRLFRVPLGRRAGEQVGRFLLGLGHRRVLYLATAPLANYSQTRLDGLREALGDTGDGSIVQVFPVDTKRSMRASDYRTEDLAAAVAESGLDGKTREALQLLLRGETDAVPKMILRQMFVRSIEPSLERALRLEGCSVWVCENDRLALASLHFLENRNVRIPAQLSVIGFDNSTEASIHGLSSYSFNDEAYIRAMVDTLVSTPERYLRTKPERVTRFDGFVVPRRTTGRAARVTHDSSSA
ncbi:MAG: GntR family transcriptional regulator [Chitinivibrionales bacterium]|nr:GntR family transcriptional regulator [Chitinivibrionales bacterium]